MTTPTYNTIAIDPYARSTELGVFSTRGGVITYDEDVGELFKTLSTGSGGNILVLGKDGQVLPYLNMNPGILIPAVGTRVLSTATLQVSGTPVVFNSTAVNICWQGGAA